MIVLKFINEKQGQNDEEVYFEGWFVWALWGWLVGPPLQRHPVQMQSMHTSLIVTDVNNVQFSKNNAPKAVQHIYETNFGFSVKSAYTFVILHLRSEDNKNPITVPIPDVCLFH